MNTNMGTALARIVVLAGGAIVGAVVANWLDKTMYERAHRQSEYDRSRYAQGLAAQAPRPVIIEESESDATM